MTRLLLAALLWLATLPAALPVFALGKIWLGF